MGGEWINERIWISQEAWIRMEHGAWISQSQSKKRIFPWISPGAYRWGKKTKATMRFSAYKSLGLSTGNSDNDPELIAQFKLNSYCILRTWWRTEKNPSEGKSRGQGAHCRFILVTFNNASLRRCRPELKLLIVQFSGSCLSGNGTKKHCSLGQQWFLIEKSGAESRCPPCCHPGKGLTN